MTTNVTYKSIAPIVLGCGNTHRYEVTMTDNANGSSFCVHSTCERDVAENFKRAGMPVPAELEGPYDGYGHRIAVKFPQVNLNGTSAKELIEQQLAVHKAADDLLSALRQATPHARDYQTHKDQFAHLYARQEAAARYHAVAKLKDEAMAIALNVQGQSR